MEKDMLKSKTRMFLSNLMQDERILKVGWAFNAEDIKMLRANCDGVFLHFLFCAQNHICLYSTCNTDNFIMFLVGQQDILNQL